MKKVYIVGTGQGEHTLTQEARETIASADVLLGAPGVLEPYTEKRTYPHYLPKDAAAFIERDAAKSFAILVSGDVGFYSAAAGFYDALPDCELTVIPGVSVVNTFFAKVKKPWQDAALISAHGRGVNVVDTVRRNRLTFCLTGNNTEKICADLSRCGFAKLSVHVGENLGTSDERVYETTVEELQKRGLPSLTVLLFINDNYDDRTPCGLPDDAFIRLPGIPMTKSEIRAVVMSKLAPRPDSICWDIGAGSGSVTAELALSAYRGHVYAVERREDAVPLIRQNCESLHIGNMTVIPGTAPDGLTDLPAPDTVFIGGSGGGLGEIIALTQHKNPDAKIVVTAVTIETVSAALTAFTGAGLDPEIVQINAARSKSLGGLHLMEAQNPITIFCAEGGGVR